MLVHHDVIPNLFMLCSWFAFLAGYVHDGLDSHGINIGMNSKHPPTNGQPRITMGSEDMVRIRMGNSG